MYMQCYKCKTNDNLSIKKHDRQGNKVYICKPCRNNAYKASSYRPPQAADKLNKADDWAILAHQNHQRIINKYNKVCI